MMRCGDVIIVFSNWIVLAASQWGEWGSFNTCDNTCGGGIQTRSRSCLTEPCAGDLFDFQACAYNECPEDGMWAEWGMWSICSQSCDGGLQERDRQCFGPFHGGQECTGDSRDSQTCNQFGCPIDGGWSTWSPFTSCTSTCGGGTRTATRTCDHPVPENNGRDCLGSSSLTEACNSQVCEEAAVVDGEWGPWSLVGDCSADCGVGVRTRSRSCTNPAPTNGGLECPGDDNKEFQCQGPPCPVNGGWGWWQEWSACSQSCLGGLRERRRICDGPPPMNGGDDCVDSTPGAPGEQWQEAECNTGPCQVIDGMWGEWSIVGRCSQTCDGGYQPRVRYCNNPQPVNGGRMCPGGDAEATARDTDQVGCRFNPCPIHGSWGVWSNYTACAATCGISVQTRTRACNNPAPEYGGVECVGTNIDTLDCGLDECFVDGGWSIWSPFGPCTETCGGGSQHRIRECTNPAPSGNGQPCSGVANDTRTCNIDPCPAVNGAWGNWGHWDDCSTSCGVGVRTRIRPCDSPAPEYGGELCPGRSTASRSCDMGVCPQDLSSLYGVCNSWSFWSECSVTCAGGKSERTRTCTDRPPADSDITCDVMATKEIEILLCNEEACPVNGYWSPWQYWSSCSVSCGSGVMSRQRHCDNPSPRNGGRICEGASVYQDSETMKVPCFLSACQDRTTTTTTTPSPNQDGVTVPQTVCPSEIAHDELVWPITDIGESVNIACPLPSTGNTTRTCMAADVWSEMDTSSCVNHNFDQLGEDLEIVDLWSNVTALTVVLEMFREACSPENIAVGEDLRTCQQIVMTLIHKNLPGNPTIPRNVKDPMIKNLLHGVGGIVDPGNKQQWRSIHKAEETEHVSLISDIVYSVEMFGRQVAAYLMENNRGSFCPVGITNLDFCVERINCEEVSFRYPKDPPDPTPPPKHIRGGWVAPEKPKLTYVTFSNDLMKEVACAPAMLSTDVYAVTVVHEDLHKLLPDANKQYIDPDEEALAGVRYSRRPNSHVISSLVVSPVNTTHLNAPLQIKLYHNKSAESAACAFMPKSLDTSIYSTDGCSISKQQENFTICECNHMTPFLLIMQPIYIPPKEDITSKSDGFMKASCIIVLLCMLAMGATYIFSKLWHTDRYFIISNMAFAMFLAELFILVGGITQDQHGCRFLAFMIHYLVTASQIWVLAVVTHAYKEIESHDQFSTNERRLYTLLSWAVPIFAPAITIGLDYDDYIMDDFCWMEWKKRVALGFYGPQVSICLVGIVVLLYCYRILDTKDKSTLTEEVEQMTYDKQRHYLLRVGGLLAATSINWTCFCVMITPLFMATNIIMGACVIVLFAVLDHDVQIALGNRRNDLKEAKRRKAHEVKLSAEMPDWVKQTQTQNRPMYFPPSEVNAPYGKEKIELFSREKDSPSPPGFAYMPKDKRKLTPHF